MYEVDRADETIHRKSSIESSMRLIQAPYLQNTNLCRVTLIECYFGNIIKPFMRYLHNKIGNFRKTYEIFTSFAKKSNNVDNDQTFCKTYQVNVISVILKINGVTKLSIRYLCVIPQKEHGFINV
jgi:hypothetical protein